MGSPATDKFVVEFPDPVLDRTVRSAIAKPDGPVLLSDLDPLTFVEAVDDELSLLEGLQNCPNLKSIDIFGCDVEDISPISDLTDLSIIEIGRNKVRDISPIGTLCKLERLSFEENNIEDITPLKNLASLTVLDLSANRISDISPLANLVNLERLFVSRNMIEDLTPLANLPKLGVLLLYKNKITDIGPLVENSHFGEGSEVDLRDNPLSDEALKVQVPMLASRGVKIRL